MSRVSTSYKLPFTRSGVSASYWLLCTRSGEKGRKTLSVELASRPTRVRPGKKVGVHLMSAIIRLYDCNEYANP